MEKLLSILLILIGLFFIVITFFFKKEKEIPETEKPKNRMKTKLFNIGLLISSVLFVSYIGVSIVNTKNHNETIKKEKNPVRLLDLNYVPSFGNDPKPSGKILIADVKDIKKDPSKYMKDISEFNDKITIINYWATFCDPCLKEMVNFAKFAEKYGDKINIIALSTPLKSELYPGESIVKFYKKNNIKNLKIALDMDGKVRKSILLQGLPTVIFISKKGEEIGRIEGKFEWSEENISLILKKLLKNN